MVRLAMAKELDFGDGMVYITDQQNMVDIMSANIDFNRPISGIQAAELDWYMSLISALTIGAYLYPTILHRRISFWLRTASTSNLHSPCCSTFYEVWLGHLKWKYTWLIRNVERY